MSTAGDSQWGNVQDVHAATDVHAPTGTSELAPTGNVRMETELQQKDEQTVQNLKHELEASKKAEQG